jgi:5-hydroxyisourate hydrolase
MVTEHDRRRDARNIAGGAMPGISIHVVDVARGVVAAGMEVELYVVAPARVRIAQATVSATGLVTDPMLDTRFSPGAYEAVLHVGDYCRRCGMTLPAVPFLDVVTYRFGISDAEQHYHLPFKLTPWGYSCFRGGA